MGYGIHTKYPNLIGIDPHFHLFLFKMPPSLTPKHDENTHHLNSNSIKNWRNDVYAFHFTTPTPEELLNEESLYQSKKIFGEMGRFILEKAVMDIKNMTL